MRVENDVARCLLCSLCEVDYVKFICTTFGYYILVLAIFTSSLSLMLVFEARNVHKLFILQNFRFPNNALSLVLIILLC